MNYTREFDLYIDILSIVYVLCKDSFFKADV